MKFPQIALINYSINDVKITDAVRKERIHDLRRKTDVLVIDDEGFAPKEFLEKNNYRLTSKSDIDNIKDVSEYSIILCDIRGVGQKLSNRYEGAFLIKEIKTNYPEKCVIAYTASQYDPSYNSYLQYADELVQKTLSMEDWLDVLDKYIFKIADPVVQWKALRGRLLKKDVEMIEICRLENAFVRSYLKDDFNGFEKIAKSINTEVETVATDFLQKVVVNLIKRSK